MSEVVGLVLPFFGLIFFGFLVARLIRQPVEALGWMNTFIIYVALPTAINHDLPVRGHRDGIALHDPQRRATARSISVSRRPASGIHFQVEALRA